MCEGIVLGRYGGTVKAMYLPFFLGLGGRISSGEQWFPWVHAEDVAGIYAHAIEKDSVTVSSNRCLPEFTLSHSSGTWLPPTVALMITGSQGSWLI